MRLTRMLLSCAITCFVLLSAVACSQDESNSTKEPEQLSESNQQTNENEQTTLLINYGDSTRDYYGDRQSYLNRVKEIMEDRHPGLRIEWTTSLNADLLTLGIWQFDFDYNNAVDLIPFFEKDQIDLDEIYSPLIEMNMIDGKLIGLPGYPQPLVVFYNKKWFDRAQIPYPDGSWTTEEFKTILLQLQKANLTDPNQPVLQMSSGIDNEPLVISNGGLMIGPNGKELEGYLDDPRTIQAMDWIIKLYREKLAISSFSKYPTQSDGNIGMSIGWSSMYSDSRNLTPDHPWYIDQVGVTLLPHFEGGEQVTTTSSYMSVIPKDSKNHDLAWEFIKELYLTNEELSMMRAKTDLLITEASVLETRQDQDAAFGPLVKNYSTFRQSAMFLNPDWFSTAMSLSREIERLANTEEDVAQALINYAKNP
jgi:multiple sugar transport system substrate-binding protein